VSICEREENKSERVNVEKELLRILEGSTDEHPTKELLGTSRPKNGRV
jgi:hypothetical protein